MGLIIAIIIGGLAGWIASNLMKADTGIFINIILGIVGASVASILLGLIGFASSGISDGHIVSSFRDATAPTSQPQPKLI